MVKSKILLAGSSFSRAIPRISSIIVLVAATVLTVGVPKIVHAQGEGDPAITMQLDQMERDIQHIQRDIQDANIGHQRSAGTGWEGAYYRARSNNDYMIGTVQQRLNKLLRETKSGNVSLSPYIPRIDKLQALIASAKRLNGDQELPPSNAAPARDDIGSAPEGPLRGPSIATPSAGNASATSQRKTGNILTASALNEPTQANLDGDAIKAYEKADALLNQAYKKILLEYKTDKLFLQRLQAAERAWIVFRDAQLEAHFPESDKQANYGSIYPVCRANVLRELTEQRTRQLNEWVNGTAEGDVCSGSIHFKK